MKTQNYLENHEYLVEQLSVAETMEIQGGGFFEDLGYWVGTAARYMYENSLRNPSSVRSVGPGIVL